MTRKIAVFTGTRADYGLLRRLVLGIERSPNAELMLVVSGSHLASERGATSAEIADDGIVPAATIPVWSADDTPLAAAHDVGMAVSNYAREFERLQPDVLVVLGDRLEAFAAATASVILGVPVAHVHGGELTEGAMDDSIRHAITKLAYLHFTSTEVHRRRVMQLGESPHRVHFLGAPIVDAVSEMPLLDADEVEERFGVHLPSPTALVTFHPAAMDVLPPVELLDELLAALLQVDGLHVILTGSNTDIGNTAVRERLADWVAANRERVDYVESFGQLGYLSTMAQVAVVAGNSSSVVLEAPVMGIPSVLVGDRQLGRPIATSVHVPAPSRHEIAAAIRAAVASERTTAREGIFGTPGFAERALAVLLAADLPRFPRKTFVDLKEAAADG